MTVKLFITGVTGYIGGDAFHVIYTAHPEWEYTCIVRNSDKGAQVASQYPKVKLVYGDLDSINLLEAEAQKADVVLNTASADHEAAAQALIRGLGAQGRETKKGYLLHLSGTGNLMFKSIELMRKGGNPDDRDAFLDIYDDWDGIDTVTSLPDYAPHRKVDKLVIAASANDLKTAIICPPCIYGGGRGPGNQRSMQLPELARCTLEKGYGIQVRKGNSYWSTVHVQDLSKLFLSLAELAISNDSVPTWGSKGYYFAENGEELWGNLSQRVANEAQKQGLINTNEVKSLTVDEADALSHFGSFLWGANSRSRALRARRLLGWEPASKSIDAEMPNLIQEEAKKVGLKLGHAAAATI